MGIYINIKISKAVTKEEWEKVYKETLFLAKKFPLAVYCSPRDDRNYKVFERSLQKYTG